VRLYDTLLSAEDPGALPPGDELLGHLNPASLTLAPDARVEPSLATAEPGEYFQFERQGYFCVDPDSSGEHLVLNRTVTLRDSWAKKGKRG